MLRLGAICVFGFTVGDDIGIPLLAIFPDTPFCLKVNIDDSEAPFEVITVSGRFLSYLCPS